MKSLQNKIFILFVLILVMVQAIAFWTLYNGNKNQELAEINNRLTTAKTIFTELFDRRLDYLQAFAETTAKDYGLKQVFNEDKRSLLVALNNHRKRINADLAMVIAENGMISAQLQRQFNSLEDEAKKAGSVKVGSEQDSEFRYSDWFHSDQSSHLYMIKGALYQLSLSPVNVGTKTIGWIAFGFEIDERLAREFKEITNLQTDFILQESGHHYLIASSSDSAKHNDDQLKLQLSQQILAGETPAQYIATHVLITEFDGQELGVYMYGLRANIVSLLQQQWWKILLLALITLLLSLTSAYFIARSISSPIKRLVTQAKVIASGHYHQAIELTEKNEIGQLAEEFNHMQLAVLQREEEIIYLANHDPLTKLPNRHKLNALLADLKAQKFAILHLNLRRLKDVNATLGHEVGDELIQEFARRLQTLLPHQAMVQLVHLGGGEFIIVANTTSTNELVTVINQALDPIFNYQGVSLQLQARIGIAWYPEHATDCSKLLQMADTAVNHTRNTGEQVQVYHSSLDVNTVERLSLINDLKLAIPANQLQLHFQPKLCLKTWKVTHAEALVRWQHPTLGMIPPDDFIHIAEQTGQIKALTRWVFLTALAQSKVWKSLAIEINVAVNISAENLKEKDFYAFICTAISEQNIAPEMVTLEVTESSVVEDPESAIKLLAKFKAHGIKISIDDYGTGYSSLAQLKQLPVHELKIDKSFIQRLEQDADDQIIVKSTIDLAHNMGLHVVAEGIEDKFSLTWLAEHHCELAQGYFISRPKPAEQLTPWLLDPPCFK